MESLICNGNAMLQYDSLKGKRKLLCILRGLPGSGKSCMAKQIAELYPGHVLISNADDYRINEEGEYIFEESKREQIHELCRGKAEEACKRGVNIVIVDKTNIYLDDVKPYVDMAKSNCYLPVITTPGTPWQNDLPELTRRNKHFVTYDVLEWMKAQYECIIPYYYGWFLFPDESERLQKLAGETFKLLFEIPSFRETICSDAEKSNFKETLSSYSMKNSSSLHNILHVTAGYTNNGRQPWSWKYNAIVDTSVGQISDLHIIGWVVTPRSMFARVSLSNAQKLMWGRDDALDGRSSITKEAKQRLEPVCTDTRFHSGSYLSAFNREYIPKKKSDCLPCASALSCEGQDEENAEQGPGSNDSCSVEPFPFGVFQEIPQRVRNFKTFLGKRYHCPAFGLGCTAHVTIGCRDEWKPVASLQDLLDIIFLELQSAPQLESKTHYALIRKYGKEKWVTYLTEEVKLPSLFTGCYFSDDKKSRDLGS